MKNKKVKSPPASKGKAAVRKPKKEIGLAALKRQLKIEVSLERVRTEVMSMRKPEDLLGICEVLFSELRTLGFTAIRNTMINIHDDEHGTLVNYDYSDLHGKTINHLPYNIHPLIENQVKQIRSAGDAFSETSFAGKELKEWWIMRKKIGEKDDPRIAKIKALHYYLFSIGKGAIGISTFDSISDTKKNLLKRFRNVFEFAYRRYADVAQAEAQARESQIQLALERVRAGAMGMQNSNELADIVDTVFRELTKLHVTLDRCIITIYDPITFGATWWLANPEPGSVPAGFFVKHNDHKPNLDMLDAWRQRTLKLQYLLEGTAKKEYDAFLFTETELTRLPKAVISGMRSFERIFLNVTFNNFGSLLASSVEPLPAEQFDILLRFGKVFDSTYTRFNDLKRAEAQVREARIEAALERVRSRSMAMHQSAEVMEVAVTLYEELKKLDFKFGASTIIIMDKATGDTEHWVAGFSQKRFLESYQVKYFKHPCNDAQLSAWKNGEKELIYKLKGHELESYNRIMFRETGYKNFPEHEKEWMVRQEEVIFSMAFMKHGALMWAPFACTDDQLEILHRFAKVFDQTYTRFLDLKKVEAQAREAQIEVALERVRAKALAMHLSTDLIDVANVLREQMGSLGQQDLESAIVHLYNGNLETFEAWYAYRPPNLLSGDVITGKSQVLKYATEWAREVIANYESSRIEYTVVASGQKIKEWYKVLESVAPAVVEYDENGQLLVPDILYYHFAKFSGGALLMISNQEPSEEASELLRRAAVVFDLAYTRFNDLKQAESQAREAKIEASLERVRSKAMSMHSSEDLSATIGIFYRELESFSITPRRCGVGLLDKDTHMAELSTMNTTAEGASIEVVGRIKLLGHPVLEAIFDHWLQQTEYHPVLRGMEIKEYYQLLRPQISFPEYPNDAVHFGYFFFFPEGGVYAWTEKEMVEDELKIYRRFTTVLNITYKRYKDLRNAEARTRLAIRESSLDRVRAGIASMRTAADLQRITPLIWHELITLDVPFFRCGVFILNEEDEKIHMYLSTPLGKPLAALTLRFDSTETNKNAIAHWRKQKVYLERWDKEQFVAFAKLLIDQGQIQTANSYQGGDEPPEALTLQFIPFAQGMLYVGSAESLSETQIESAQALADAFSVAYARYEDFIKLESAKAQIEKTLADLKQTQTQLIQSEKMASLGELTAGIAHEIQNPLNFVNNFSEVSTELVDEMNDELQKGNTEDAKKIAADLKQNLEKINHHGKRAGDIVKGMLQHSSSGSGVKEPTDINALADEYLRLAYHGLRAKDKSFNASMDTAFDEHIGNINVIRQDLGRVILNLVTNAFYAVNERSKQLGTEYEPTVTVSTRKDDEKIVITIKDNGVGIAQKVLDKIFQPFFTTKPAGRGTGLGLSLSYDIVKAHGGELRVATKEGEGSEFMIVISTD